MAKWAARQTRNPEVLKLFHSGAVFKTSATLENSPLVCLWPVGMLSNVMANLSYLFQLFAQLH